MSDDYTYVNPMAANFAQADRDKAWAEQWKADHAADLTPTVPPRTAPFKGNECQCCLHHTPKPLTVELHHVHPQYDQRLLYGRVRDGRVIPLCRTAHRNLHDYLTALMAGATLPDVNPYTVRWAREGLARIAAAHEAAGVPIAPGGGGE